MGRGRSQGIACSLLNLWPPLGSGLPVPGISGVALDSVRSTCSEGEGAREELLGLWVWPGGLLFGAISLPSGTEGRGSVLVVARAVTGLVFVDGVLPLPLLSFLDVPVV